MNQLERAMHREYVSGSRWQGFARCATCGQMAFVVQKPRRPRECFDCYAKRKDEGR